MVARLSRRGRMAALGLAGGDDAVVLWGYDPADVSPATTTGPSVRAFARWTDSVGLRLSIGVLAVVLAYHYSLQTLVHTLGLNTPLAYLGLVPPMAAGLAWARRSTATGPDIHDRQLDLIVGLTLISGALLALLVLPGRLGSLYWVYRLDLLTLPFFVAGVVCLLFGTRAVWHQRIPIGFLFLAWPQPYVWLIEHALDGALDSTLWALRHVLSVWHVARASVAGDGSQFDVVHHGQAFQVSVASACAGVNSQIGFLLVAVAALALVRGRWISRVVWLVLGLSLVFALNVFRLVLVMWVGQVFGEEVAIDGFHPYVGLVVFGLGVTAMSLAMPRFGLHTVASTQVTERGSGLLHHLGNQLTGLFARRPLAASGLRIAAVACLVGTVVAGVTNSDLSRFRLVASDVGGSRISPFTSGAAAVPSASVFETNRYDWVTQYFGRTASWHRYTYSPRVQYTPAAYGTRAATPAVTQRPVIADVIQGQSLGDFQDYGLEACYTFHGYDLSGTSTVDLGDGVGAQTLTFRSPRATEDTVALWWIWSVALPDGRRAYERVVLLDPLGVSLAPTPQSSPLKGVGYGDQKTTAATATPTQAAQKAGLAQVSELGREIVASRVASALPASSAVTS